VVQWFDISKVMKSNLMTREASRASDLSLKVEESSADAYSIVQLNISIHRTSMMQLDHR